jgi:prepilin-type N-terminal cleavage/methylation domain-containing protein
METTVRAHGAGHGFSMVELLVTVVLAGIIFTAMVPVFANALKKTSGDNFRVTATNIAQDRIEKIRMLNYGDISDTNLNDTGFAQGQFGGSFTPFHSNKTYTIDPYIVVDVPNSTAPTYKKITVTVRWSPTESTTMQTVVMNPAAVVTGSTPTPTATPAPHSTTGTNYVIDVSVTNDTVTSQGVTVVRTDVTPNTTMTPTKQIPNAANGMHVTWTNLVGGPDVFYKITVYFQVSGHSAESKTTTINLVDSYPVFFDTDPYH